MEWTSSITGPTVNLPCLSHSIRIRMELYIEEQEQRERQKEKVCAMCAVDADDTSEGFSCGVDQFSNDSLIDFWVCLQSEVEAQLRQLVWLIIWLYWFSVLPWLQSEIEAQLQQLEWLII